jgi:hypothetical protein
MWGNGGRYVADIPVGHTVSDGPSRNHNSLVLLVAALRSVRIASAPAGTLSRPSIGALRTVDVLGDRSANGEAYGGGNAKRVGFSIQKAHFLLLPN